jgi:hypothetical protein
LYLLLRSCHLNSFLEKISSFSGGKANCRELFSGVERPVSYFWKDNEANPVPGSTTLVMLRVVTTPTMRSNPPDGRVSDDIF